MIGERKLKNQRKPKPRKPEKVREEKEGVYAVRGLDYGVGVIGCRVMWFGWRSSEREGG